MSFSPFVLTSCAASIDGSLSLTGVVTELEEQDVAHVLLWERIDGEWKRYQWNSRCRGVAMYPEAGRSVSAYLGQEGTLKVRSQTHGSSVQILDSSEDDAPSSLRSVSAIRTIGDRLFVVGMRRMVYRRGFGDTDWTRCDDGMRQAPTDRAVAGLRSIDGTSATQLIAVGLGGEIWIFDGTSWRQEPSPTEVRLATVRCLDASTTVIGGAEGVLLMGSAGQWRQVAHDFTNETFTCIEHWAGRTFVCSEKGALFELFVGDTPRLESFASEHVPSTWWLTATAERVFFLGRSSVWSLGEDGWKDESPPAELIQK